MHRATVQSEGADLPAERAGVAGEPGALSRSLRERRGSWWLIALGFPVAVQIGQLLLLCIRFRAWPNYISFYNWPANILLILKSVPSFRDRVAIGSEEWLVEVGRRSVIYGLTVSDWRLAILPAKVALLALVGALLATNCVLLRGMTDRSCTRARTIAASFTASGTLFTSLTAVTVSWIACCGVPSWVTGLSVLGLSYTTALLLKPHGAAVAVVGALCLLLATVVSLVSGALRARYRTVQ